MVKTIDLVPENVDKLISRMLISRMNKKFLEDPLFRDVDKRRRLTRLQLAAHLLFRVAADVNVVQVLLEDLVTQTCLLQFRMTLEMD